MNRRYWALVFLVVFSGILVSQEKVVELDELVIEASRTEGKLTELPVSVSVLPKGVLENNEIPNLTEVTAFVPNLVMLDYGSKLTTPVFIRGIGSRINAPSVGLYVDGVPYFEKGSFNFDFFDLQSIEVLRGPQGTLFGRNAMGGIINIKSLSPFDYQGTKLMVSGGNYGLFKVNVGHFQQVNDKLAYSISANYQHSDGMFYNSFRNEKVDSLNSYGLRAKIQYLINQNWTFDFTHSMEHSEQGGYPYAKFNTVDWVSDPVNYNQVSGYERFLMTDALKLKYTDANFELSNSVSFQKLDDVQSIDQDFTSDSVYFVGQSQDQTTFTDELLVRSRGNSRYSWLFGAFGFLQRSDNLVDFSNYYTTTAAVANLFYTKNNRINTSGLAFFHQSSYEIFPTFTATAGIRVDYEKSALEYHYSGTRKGIALAAVDTLYPSISDLVVLPKLALSYAFLDANQVFASYTSGYKPGGFNASFESIDQLSFKSETSDNFEIGIKNSWFNKWIYSDATYFYTVLKNQQIYRILPSGRGSYLDNSGSSLNQGFELSLQNKKYHGFSAILSYGYTHAQIKEYVKSSTEDYSGKMTPYIPRHTFSVQANQTFSIPNCKLMDRLDVNLSYNEIGTMFWDLNNLLEEKAYGILNAKLALSKGVLKVELWAKNLTSTQYNAFLFEMSGGAYAQPGKPLQLGANLIYKF